jgi:drug/metabolite transporter (DMT)-like permease
LLAAALFGATTPLAKALLGSLSPFLLAGLFYLGSGSGLAAVILARRFKHGGAGQQAAHNRFPLHEVPWLAGAIAAGGVAGPALLMLGLNTTPAATGSLLLNLEGVFTALIAWIVFRENVDVQVFLGMAAIVAGGVALSWQPGAAGLPPGTLLLVGACACWAVDNNLTRKVSTHDAMFIACIKGLVAGSVTWRSHSPSARDGRTCRPSRWQCSQASQATASVSCCSSLRCAISAPHAPALISRSRRYSA